MLEDDMNQRRAEYFKKVQLENKKLAIEKKKREERWRQEQAKLDLREIVREDDAESLTFTKTNPFSSSLGLYDTF